MTDHTRISVVIPSYNRADKLEGALRSALDQEPGPLEVIVVDDASTDATDEKKLCAMDPRVRVIRHARNQGAANARNTGIDAATGDWIAFLDADDRWLPGKLARQWPQVAACPHEDVFACGNVVFEGGWRHGRLWNDRPPHDGEDISRYFLLHGCTFQTSTLLVSRRVAAAFRFDRRAGPHDDWDFSLRVIRSGARVIYCHEPLARYWDATDPKRLSQQPSFEPTLKWYRTAGPLIAADAAVAFYFRAVFKRQMAQQPAAAVATALRLTLSGPDALAYVLRKIMSNGRARLFRPGPHAH